MTSTGGAAGAVREGESGLVDEHREPLEMKRKATRSELSPGHGLIRRGPAA